MNNYNSGKLKNEKDPCCLSRSGRRLRHVYSSSSLMNMEKAENEENGTTNSVNNPPPPASTHYCRVVYTLFICVQISSGSGLIKSFILNS